MKSGSLKRPPKKKIYKCYKNFVIEQFSNTLRENLERGEYNSCKIFECFKYLCHSKGNSIQHGTIIQAGITCKKVLL